MERKLRFLLVLAIVVGMGGMSGCNKEEAAMEVRKSDPVVKFGGAGGADPETQILGFIHECKKQRGGEAPVRPGNISNSDAACLLEATFNYAFGHPMTVTRKRQHDTVHLMIPCTGDSLTLTATAHCANLLLDSLSHFYASLAPTDKKVLTVKVDMMPSAQSNTLFCTAVFEIGYKVLPGLSSPMNFGNTDYWYWGFLQGKCGPYSGSNFGEDATTVFMAQQDVFKPIVIIPPGMKLYYTNFVDKWANAWDLPDPNNVIPQDNYYDFKLFLSNPAWPDFHDCLNPQEMDIYFNNLNSVIWTDLFPAGMTNSNCHFVNLLINSIIVPSSGPSPYNNAVAHKVCVKYGQPHFGIDLNYPLPLPGFQWF